MADKAFGLKTNSLVTIRDEGVNYTILRVGTRGQPLSLPKDDILIDVYRNDARRVIDELSKDMNPMDIDRFAAALLYEVLVESYHGKDNQS